MTSKLKALGLAFIVVFAMSAVAASGAQAAGTFTWSAGTTEFTAEADPTTPSQIFTITTKTGGKGSITCNELSAKGTVSGSSATEITAESIVFADTGTTATKGANWCTASIGGAETEAEVKMNGCSFKFTAGTTLGTAAEGKTEGTVDIICPAGKSIEVITAGCTVLVHGGAVNENLGPVFYRTVKAGTKKEVTVEAQINTVVSEHKKGITYTTKGAVCGSQLEASDRNDGAYTGTSTVKGYSGLPHDAAHQTEVTVE